LPKIVSYESMMFGGFDVFQGEEIHRPEERLFWNRCNCPVGLEIPPKENEGMGKKKKSGRQARRKQNNAVEPLLRRNERTVCSKEKEGKGEKKTMVIAREGRWDDINS